MHSYFAQGQKVRFNRRCVLTSNIPEHSQNYSHMALRAAADETYEGDGIIEAGTMAVVVDYASHGTSTQDNPIVRIGGRRVRCHPSNLDAV